MSKKKLIRNLEKDIYCRIQPSPLQGVGVYAIKDIPINTNPFKTPTGNCTTDSYISVSPNELKGVSKKIITLLNDFLGLDKHTNTYSIPKNGLNTLDITYYLNHGNNHNLDIVNHPECDFVIFKTNQKIKKGTELLINYQHYDS